MPTSDPDVVVDVWGNSKVEVNFLNFKRGCIEGYKWEDVDGDGVYDPGLDQPIEGWYIELWITGYEMTPEGPISFIAILDWTWTDENGSYRFCGLGPGTYIVVEELRDGWEPTSPPRVQLDKVSGTVQRVDFLNFAYGCICGWKWNDLDGDGIWEWGEPGLPGWKISMIRDADPTVYVTYTDEYGFYYFGGLWHDYYVVWEEAREGWCNTTQQDAIVWVWSGDCVLVPAFGNFQCVWIPIFKYEDVNGNGVYDNGDRPLEGWEFTIYHPAGWPIANGTTGPDGMVYFKVCKGGWYTVVEPDRVGWIHTTPPVVDVYIESGYKLKTLMFGNFALGMIYGLKVHDWNLNGEPDLGEEGLQNWMITLWIWDPIFGWWPVATRLTDTGGYYEFLALGPGLYAVSEEGRPGWMPTSPQWQPVPIQSGTVAEVDFTNALFHTIDGYKFYDKDLDGFMGADEPSLPGWVITLDGTTVQGEPVHMEFETGSDGMYNFSVQPGVYMISELLPGMEWYPTTPLPIVIDASDVHLCYHFRASLGNVRYGMIYGWKFLDTYAKSYPFWPNGIFDWDEYGLGNWKITLQGWTDTGVWVNRVTYTENEDWNTGYYEFDNLLPGMYWVNETLQYGYYATRPISNLVMVYPFPQGPVWIRIDFGNLLPSKDPEVRFVLAKGVNLWSSPLTVSGGLTASKLAAAIGANLLKISKFDTATGKYVSYIPNVTPWDFAIELGVGYFVVVKDLTSFTLKGEFASKTTAALAKGVNIVGYTSLKPTTASQLVSLVTGCKVIKVSYFDVDTGKYKSFVPGVTKVGSQYDFTVTQGRAYFLVTAAPGTLSITV